MFATDQPVQPPLDGVWHKLALRARKAGEAGSSAEHLRGAALVGVDVGLGVAQHRAVGRAYR